MTSRIENLSGMRFGRLVVIEYAGKNKYNRTTWNCLCDCGKFTTVVSYSLKGAATSSCGCYSTELTLKRHDDCRNGLLLKYFGNLFVESINRIEYNKTFFNCKCDCGADVVVVGANLSNGHTKSCGCITSTRLKNKIDNHRKTIVGEKFGRLRVVSLGPIINKSAYYNCVCDCGKKTTKLGTTLTRSNTTSCGCYAKEILRDRMKTHGLSNHRLYRTWASMIQRCYNPNFGPYRYYGEREVEVCEEWRADFMNFYNWAMENGYQPDLTIERVDNNGNYGPSNCKWATMNEQARNKRTTRFTKEEIEKIRKDPRKQIDIAKDYGVAQGVISNIKLNKTWRL